MNDQVKALYIDTIKKELRNKTLVFALLFSTLSILIGYSLTKVFVQNGMTINEMSSAFAVNAMLAFLNFWAVMIAIFFGVSAVRSDFQSNIIYQYLSFPISRSTYFLTRLIGTWSMVFGFYLYSYLLTYILFHSINKAFTPTGGQFVNLIIMGLFTLMYLNITFIISMFLNRLGALVTMGFIWILISLSNSAFGLMPYTDYFKDFSVYKLILFLIHWLMPRLGVLSEISKNVLLGIKNEYNLPVEFSHFVITSVLLVYVGTIILKKKDF